MIQYKQIVPYVYSIDYKLPIDLLTIVGELEKADWNPWGVPDQQRSTSTANRFQICNFNNNLVLDNVAKYFYDDNGYKTDFLDHIFRDTKFGSIWAFSKQEMFDRCTPTVNYYRDNPNFEMCIHLDNRRLVSSGMITFTADDDPRVSTFFYSNEDGHNQIRVENGNGKGWTAATTHNT